MAIAAASPSIVVCRRLTEAQQHIFGCGCQAATRFCCECCARVAAGCWVCSVVLFWPACTKPIGDQCAWAAPRCPCVVHDNVEDEVGYLRGAVASDIEALPNAFAQLWNVDFPPCCSACFFYESAQPVAGAVMRAVNGPIRRWVT